jgi:hypothetical protein
MQMASSAAPANREDHLAASSWYTAEVVSQRVHLVQQIYRTIMKPDTHYGVIPGCKQPSLYKAGSEQLLMTFRLAATPDVVDLSTPDCARYRVAVNIVHAPTGAYLGSGIGECSSDELKYKWRAATCDEEFDQTPADRRRLHWKNGARGAYSVKQVRQEIADVANTVLKMAKKRAQIDATLTVTAASDIFTQDLEDQEVGVTGEEARQTAMPQRKSSQGATASTQTKQQPERRAENVTPPTAGGSMGCPDCGEQLGERGCNSCGWMPEPSPEPEPQQRPRQATQPEQPKGEKISEAQAKRFFAICMGAGITKPEIRQHLKTVFGVDSDRDLLKGQYDEAIAWAEGR